MASVAQRLIPTSSVHTDARKPNPTNGRSHGKVRSRFMDGSFRGRRRQRFQMLVKDAADFLDGGRLVLARMKTAHDKLRLDVIDVGAVVGDQAVAAQMEIPLAFHGDDG